MSPELDQKPVGSEADLAPIVFPYYVGPRTRYYTTALLYSGNLVVSSPAWPHPDPIDSFFRVGDRAYDKQHELLPIFSTVSHHFELVQKQAISAMDGLRPLKGRLINAMTVYPGTEDQYKSWECIHDPCLYLAASSLEDPQMMNVAAIDFIFRTYELVLEHGDDHDKILSILFNRAKFLGNSSLLLAECALNRFTMPRTSHIQFFTDSDHALEILANVGRSIQDDQDTSDLRKGQLEFFLFDMLVSPYAPKLSNPHAESISQLMDKRSGELERLRLKCSSLSEDLLAKPPPESKLSSAIVELLNTVEEEVSSIANIDKFGFRNLIKNLSEDKVVWSSIAGLVGSIVSGLPAAVAASMAITALSAIGATAVKESRKCQEALSSSQWAFVYYLKRSGS